MVIGISVLEISVGALMFLNYSLKGKKGLIE
jgi:hypothetical protein